MVGEENSNWPSHLKQGPEDTIDNAYRREDQLLRLLCIHLHDASLHKIPTLSSREIAWDILEAMYGEDKLKQIMLDLWGKDYCQKHFLRSV
jgi:hypothetical protein